MQPGCMQSEDVCRARCVRCAKQSRQMRDDEDALNSMSDDYGGNSGSPSHAGGGGTTMAAPRETAAERRVREEAEYAWAPPSQTSQKKMDSLAAKLGY